MLLCGLLKECVTVAVGSLQTPLHYRVLPETFSRSCCALSELQRAAGSSSIVSLPSQIASTAPAFSSTHFDCRPDLAKEVAFSHFSHSQPGDEEISLRGVRTGTHTSPRVPTSGRAPLRWEGPAPFLSSAPRLGGMLWESWAFVFIICALPGACTKSNKWKVPEKAPDGTSEGKATQAPSP